MRVIAGYIHVAFFFADVVLEYDGEGCMARGRLLFGWFGRTRNFHRCFFP